MTTSSDEKKGLNVPPLRFPEFKGEWESTTLGSLVDFKNGINVDSSKYGSGTKYISVSDILDQGPILYKSIRGSLIASEDQLREFSVTYGDILFQRSSETVEDIGQANVYLDSKPCLFGGFVIRGKKKADYNPLYMKYALKAPVNRKKVIIKGAGAQHYNIGQENLSSICLSICKKEEQQKLSLLLSDVDMRIGVQRKIIEDTKNLKKALLQKVFPREGETIPSLRFKGFTEPWEQRKAKDLCSITTGKSNTQDQVEDGKYPFFIRSDIPVKSNRYLYDQEAVITIGDGNIGRVFHYINGKFDLHQRCYKMADFNGIDGKYFYYYFSTKFYKRAMLMTAKATVDSVRLEMISDMDIFFPENTKEQKLIASYLTNLDSLITLHQRKADSILQVKKFLLANLFC